MWYSLQRPRGRRGNTAVTSVVFFGGDCESHSLPAMRSKIFYVQLCVLPRASLTLPRCPRAASRTGTPNARPLFLAQAARIWRRTAPPMTR